MSTNLTTKKNSSNNGSTPPAASAMKKDVTNNANAAVLSLPSRRQVDLLAQALLREYMHRRGYQRTLQTFDKENPRTESTISSRQLMSDMMRLQRIQGRHRFATTPKVEVNNEATTTSSSAIQTPPPGAQAATFMEMLCAYRLRKRGLRCSRSTGAGSGGASDSSDDDLAMERKAKKHADDVAAVAAAELGQVQARIAEKKAELEALLAREEKLKKKNGKATKGKGGKKSADGVTPDSAAEATAGSNKGGTKKASAVKVDPLADAMQRIASLPLNGNGSRNGTMASVGRNWTPGGTADGGASNVPDIGLSGKEAASTAGSIITDKPPNFVAGFDLMADRCGSSSRRADIADWEAPVTRPNRSGSGGLRENSSDHDDVPSPYRLGKTVYDHNATRPGIIKDRAAASGSDAVNGKSTMPSPPSNVTFAPPPSASSTGTGGASISRTDSGSSLCSDTGSGSPTSREAGGPIGFNYHGTGGSSSPPGERREGSAGSTSSTTSSRKSRRVTILAE